MFSLSPFATEKLVSPDGFGRPVLREPAHSLHAGFFFLFFFFNLTYGRWTSPLPSCLWSLRIFPSLPGSRLTILLSRCKFSTLTTRQPMVEFHSLTFPRFLLRKKEHKSYFGKNRTHDFRTSRCAGYLLDHSGDEEFRNYSRNFCRFPRRRPHIYRQPLWGHAFACRWRSLPRVRWHSACNMPLSRMRYVK